MSLALNFSECWAHLMSVSQRETWVSFQVRRNSAYFTPEGGSSELFGDVEWDVRLVGVAGMDRAF